MEKTTTKKAKVAENKPLTADKAKQLQDYASKKAAGYTTIETTIDGVKRTLRFKKPSKVVYSNIFSFMSKKDYYEVLDILIKNLYLAEPDFDLRDSEVDKMQIFNEVAARFLAFTKTTITVVDDPQRRHNFLFSLTVAASKEQRDYEESTPESYNLLIKPLERKDYKEIFNRLIDSPLSAVNYIMQDLLVEESRKEADLLGLDALAYASTFSIADYLLRYKEASIKKK